ncbi:MAG: endonuclease III [Clostridia bacterium]|nr:endonuclease III [Clostridia bacterium]
MNKKEKVLEIQKIFDIIYKDAKCSLDFENPLQLLIATQLAAQCTDKRVNQVTPALFERYKTAEDFATADISELEGYIKSTGFFRNKAKNIINCCKKIVTDFDGKVPETMEELTSLDGVGRKTANIIIGDIYGKPAIVIDTHAKRLANRMGLTKNSDPTKIEFDLMKIVPPETSADFCHKLVYHGRAVCKAIKPRCDICEIAHICSKKI